jgi:sporulation protein YlmC with PRC-barrel domain
MTISEQLIQRADLIGTQVITRDTGKKLGVINQLWVDVDQREVTVVGLRGTLFTGEQRYMFVDTIRQIGDVILVDNDAAVEAIDVTNYSSLIENEVVTETGELLGKVRGFKFDSTSSKVTSLVIGSFGLPWIPERWISTYELPIEELASVGPDRLIVFEGSETRLNQLTVGLMERLGIGAPPWQQDEESYLPQTTPTSNQLGAGQRATYTPPAARRTPAAEDNWQEEEAWAAEPAKPAQTRRQAIPEPETDNWGGSEPTANRSPNRPAPDGDLEDDVWGEEPYEAPKVNIPERRRAPEYQQEEL